MKGNCGECSRRWYCETNPDDCDEWPDPVPITNAQKIRAMSDEQLAEFLLSPLDLCAKCKETGKHCIVGFSSKHNEHCMNTMAKWIKQTVEIRKEDA